MSNRERGPVRRSAKREGGSIAVIAAAALLCAASYVFIYATGRANPPIRSDGFSYYVYLPAWVIYHDPSLASVARDCCGGEFPAFTAIIRWPGTRRWVNAHPIGVAVMQSPFFLAAHGLTKWSNLSADGFTFYYQHAAGIAGGFWAIAGLVLMRRLLLRHFSDRVTSATLVVLFCGTGLLHYATYDSSYSHTYSFFLLAALLNLTEEWWSTFGKAGVDTSVSANAPVDTRRSVLLGLVAGLIVLTRHTNVLLLLAVPLYGVSQLGVRKAITAALAHRRDLAIAAVVAALALLPQLAIYYVATGRWVVSSYGDLTFNFTSPHLWGVLFSVQKGLFFWSPVLFLAVAGFWLAPDRTRPFMLAAGLIFAADAYLIASWWDWQFGGSYGHRGFVDLLPLFAIGLAGFFTWSAANRPRTVVVGLTTCALVLLSMFQMLQYWNGVMPISDITWEQYKSLFLRWQ